MEWEEKIWVNLCTRNSPFRSFARCFTHAWMSIGSSWCVQVPCISLNEQSITNQRISERFRSQSLLCSEFETHTYARMDIIAYTHAEGWLCIQSRLRSYTLVSRVWWLGITRFQTSADWPTLITYSLERLTCSSAPVLSLYTSKLLLLDFLSLLY